ncbi:MAG: alcohol dehydrogenase catalytic domain-containing protein, partial [bacterium]
MKAVVLHEHGGPEVLKFEEIPTPPVGPGEVRVRVGAVALNHLDIWVRNGIPGLRLKYPHILGSDIAGEIDAVADGADASSGGPALNPGARVLVAPGVSCGRCEACLSGRDNLCRDYGILGEHRTGGYAEFITVPAQNILPFPESLSVEQAASIPLAFLTAWQMVSDKANVQAGETVLVMAAGSGVSTAAIQ